MRGLHCCSCFLLLFVASLRTGGQQTLRPVSRLEEALKTWDPARSGSLIAVDPGRAQPHASELQRRNPGAPDALRRPEPLTPDASLLAVLAYYGRQLLRSGALTVVAPLEMKVLNTRLGEPDLYTGMEREVKLKLLQGSLTRTQWQKIGSPEGLGLGDLNREQQALFLSILPDPFTVRKGTVQNGMVRESPGQVTLPPDARARVRLRLSRTATFSFPAETRPNTWFLYNEGRPRTEGEQLLFLDRGRRTAAHSPYGAELAHHLPNRPKPGDLDFNAELFDRTVSLLPPPAGSGQPTAGSQSKTQNPKSKIEPITVSILVKRIAAATKLELYADPRAGDLPVWTSGQSARAGDVLRALCLAVTGTFRKVGPAYVLTDDLKGIGARRCLIDEWLAAAAAKEAEMRAEAEAAIRGAQPEQYVGFAAGVQLPLPAERIGAIKPGWDRFSPGGSMEVAIAELPAAWQTRLRDEALRGSDAIPDPQGTGNYRARTDRVRITVMVSPAYVVPGVGVVDEGVRTGSSFGSHSEAPSTPGGGRAQPETGDAQPDLPALPLRSLHVAPSTAEEAARLAAEAKQRGYTHLWLELPETGGKELLAAGLKICKEQGIGLMPVVRLLFRPDDGRKPTPVEEAENDLNILGESGSSYLRRRNAPLERLQIDERERFARRGDWLRFDTRPRPATLQLAIDVAGTPGIAGLVMRDSAAPGYCDSGKSEHSPVRGGWDFGYTLSHRHEFLRKASCDPIDIPFVQNARFPDLVDLPFFSDQKVRPQYTFAGEEAILMPGRTLTQHWNAYRYGLNGEWMTAMHRELRAKAPELPLLLEGRWSVSFPMIPGRYVYWEKADATPDFSPGAPGDWEKATAAFRTVHSYSHLSWRMMPAPGSPQPLPPATPLRPDDPAVFARALAKSVTAPGTKWEGLSVDLSDLPAERVLDFLKALPPVGR